MPGRCVRYRSTAAIRRRMAHENPAGVPGQGGACVVWAGSAATGVGCPPGPPAAGLADGGLSTPQPASTASASAAQARAAARPAEAGRDARSLIMAPEHTNTRGRPGPDRPRSAACRPVEFDAHHRREPLQALLQLGQVPVAGVVDPVPHVVGVSAARWSVGSGSGIACGTCEQAARTLSRTELGVCGWNCTTASCLPNVRSKVAQPATAGTSAASMIPTAGSTGRQRRGGRDAGMAASLRRADPRPAPARDQRKTIAITSRLPGYGLPAGGTIHTCGGAGIRAGPGNLVTWRRL